MDRAVNFSATAGVFDPRGRLDVDATQVRVDAALPCGPSGRYGDRWLVLATSNGAIQEAAGTCVLLDGRLENTRVLASELGLEAGRATSALVAAAWAKRREGALELLRGSFVVGAWERARAAGLLGVDQLGGRSLFYAPMPSGALAFASELVTLLALLPARPAPRPEGVAGWLLGMPDDGGATLYHGVRRLGGAHMLELSGSGWRERRYWVPRYQEPLDGDRADLAQALWEHVVGAAGVRLDDHDRPAIILSGGIDSSVVAAATLEATEGRTTPSTYSAVFPELPEIDESERIDALVDALDLNAVELALRPSGALAAALEYTERWSLPLLGPGSALEQPLVERAGAEGATVIFDGQAGDEIFGHSPFLVADRILHGRLASSFSLAADLVPEAAIGRTRRRYVYRVWKQFGLQAAIPDRIHVALRRLRGRRALLPVWFAAPAGTFDTRAPSDWAWKGHGGPRWWAHRLFTTVQMRDKRGLNDYLRHRAWVVGADARPPLLDVDLIEFVLRLPPQLGFQSRFPDRPLIREAMQDRVPEAVRLNPVKSNVSKFYYENLAGIDLAPMRRLLSPAAEVGAYADLRHVADLLERPPGAGAQGWYEWINAVWRLATIEVWLRQEADPTFAAQARAEQDVLPTIRVDHRVRRRRAAYA